MLKAIKGCMNELCEAYKKKEDFSAKYIFCPKCGQELYFVCKECRMKLENGSKKYCVRCESMRKDAREQLAKTVAGKIGKGASTAANATVKVGKKTKDAAGDIVTAIKERKKINAENVEIIVVDTDNKVDMN